MDFLIIYTENCGDGIFKKFFLISNGIKAESLKGYRSILRVPVLCPFNNYDIVNCSLIKEVNSKSKFLYCKR